MNRIVRYTYYVLAMAFFGLATVAVLGSLFYGSASGTTPGLFFAIVLAGIGRWLLGKCQGRSARETFGRTIKLVEPDAEKFKE